jgi:hypothetical protein
MVGTGNIEIRISKHETKYNKENSNDQNVKQRRQGAFVSNFGHLNFDIVSDFEIRYSDFALLFSHCPAKDELPRWTTKYLR